MERLVILAGAALAFWAISCVLMVLFASRLPDGLLRQIVELLPSCVTTARVLRADPAVPRRAKVALLVAVLWVVSPIDVLPEFLPVIGPRHCSQRTAWWIDGWRPRSHPRCTIS